MRSTWRPERWAFFAVAVALAAMLAYPLRRGHAAFDDFVYIALSTHIDAPWVLLVQDSLGSYFFRPIGMLTWWATVAAFGNEPSAHYAFNLSLHAVNALLLHALARRHGIAFLPASVAALVFMAHPTTFSASAWLSDRFDLLATAFGLGCLIAMERYLDAPRRLPFALVVLAALACALSKEIGFAFLAAAMGAAAWPAQGHAVDLRQRARIVMAIGLAALAVLAARHLALRASPEGSLLAVGIGSALAGGFLKWLRALPPFLVVVYGSPLAIAAWCAGLALLLLALVRGAARGALITGSTARAAGIGLLLAGLAAAAQSPVVNATPVVPFETGTFDFASLAGSRFFYVAFAGFSLALAAALDAAMREPFPRPARWVLGAAAVVALAGLVASSRAIGRDWAAFTTQRSDRYVKPALAAAKNRGGGNGCLVFLLDTPFEANHFRAVADTAVKQGLERGSPAMKCFFQSEHAPWNHLVAGDAPFAPLQQILVAGKPFAPLRVSNLTHHYLSIPAGDVTIDAPQSVFLSYRAGQFVDVTAEVRARRKKVFFYDNRLGS